MNLSLRPEAEQDISEAYRWYSKRAPHLAAVLLDEIEAALGRIAEAPLSLAICYRDVRRLVMRRFPYVIYFRVREERVDVIGVMHGRRSPGTWKRRT